jgi:hypothetical protein
VTLRHAFLRATCHTGLEGTTCWLSRFAQSYGNLRRRAVNTNRPLIGRAQPQLRRGLNLNAALPVDFAADETGAISAAMDLSRTALSVANHSARIVPFLARCRPCRRHLDGACDRIERMRSRSWYAAGTLAMPLHGSAHILRHSTQRSGEVAVGVPNPKSRHSRSRNSGIGTPAASIDWAPALVDRLIFLANETSEAHPILPLACIGGDPETCFAGRAGDGFGPDFSVTEWIFILAVGG